MPAFRVRAQGLAGSRVGVRGLGFGVWGSRLGLLTSAQ